MSQRTSIVYGFGWKVYASDAGLCSFALKHQKTVESCGIDGGGRRLLQYISEGKANVKEDFYDDFEGIAGSGATGIYNLIIEVIYKETGIRLQYEPGDADCESTDTILLPDCQPWQLSEKERGLTEESLTAILLPYIRELGDMSSNPGYEEVEYFG